MLPMDVASALLLASGAWWTASVFLYFFWGRHYETPGRRNERLQEREEGRNRASSVITGIMLSLPTVVTLGLALDGLSGTRAIFYAPGWSWSLPGAAVLQVLGAILVFVALPLMTSTVYFIDRYAYSRLPTERILVQHGPYALVRHPMHLAALLLGIGWILLAQNFVALVFLIMLEGVLVARKEEVELVETYGDTYRAYQRRTGFFFPRLRKSP